VWVRHVTALTVVALAAVVASVAGASSQAALRVPGRADLFYAGLMRVPVPGLASGGILPVLYRLPSGRQRVLTVTHTAGTLTWGAGSTRFDADGTLTGELNGGATNVTGYRGISGIHVRKDQLFLAGVFLDNAAPKRPAPARLSLPNASSLATLAPKLQQIFPIGDGRTSSGALQRFTVPAGATRLYLGYVDAASFSGKPGYYADNTGSITATVQVSH
jgi:hypothetical protein